MIQVTKLIGAGLTTISLAGSGVGIGVVFASLIGSIARNPALLKQLSAHLILASNTFELNVSSNKTFSSRYNIFYFLSFSSLEDYGILPFVTLIVGIYLTFGLSYYVANQLFATEDPLLKKTFNVVVAFLISADALYIASKNNLIFSWPFPINPMLVFVGISLTSFVLCYVASASFRNKIPEIAEALATIYLNAIERTVSSKLVDGGPLVKDEALIVYHFLVTSSVLVVATICWQQPLYFHTCYFFLILVETLRYFYRKYKGTLLDFSLQTAELFDAFIISNLFFSIVAGILIPMTTLFIGFVLFSFLESYQNNAPQMSVYTTAYKAALPELNTHATWKRFQLKFACMCILVFPLFLSSYSYTLSFYFGGACVAKWLIFFYQQDAEISMDALSISTSSLLFSGLYLFVWAFLYNLWVQVLRYNKSSDKDNTILGILINTIGWKAVCGVIGNHPGTNVTGAGSAHAGRNIFGLVAVVTSFVAVKVLDIYDKEKQRQGQIRQTQTNNAALNSTIQTVFAQAQNFKGSSDDLQATLHVVGEVIRADGTVRSSDGINMNEVEKRKHGLIPMEQSNRPSRGVAITPQQEAALRTLESMEHLELPENFGTEKNSQKRGAQVKQGTTAAKFLEIIRR